MIDSGFHIQCDCYRQRWTCLSAIAPPYERTLHIDLALGRIVVRKTTRSRYFSLGCPTTSPFSLPKRTVHVRDIYSYKHTPRKLIATTFVSHVDRYCSHKCDVVTHFDHSLSRPRIKDIVPVSDLSIYFLHVTFN